MTPDAARERARAALSDAEWAKGTRLVVLDETPERFRFQVVSPEGGTLFGAPWLDVDRTSGVVSLVPPLR